MAPKAWCLVVKMGLLVVLGTLSAVWPGPVFAADAMVQSAEQFGEPSGEQSNDKPVGESSEKPPEPAEGKRRPLQSLVQGATPEEQARLVEERKRLSAADDPGRRDAVRVCVGQAYLPLRRGRAVIVESSVRGYREAQ